MEKIAPDTLAVLQRVSTDTITGQLLKMAGLRTRAVQGVRPVQPARCRMVGPAYTMRFVPIREDLTDRSSVVSPASHLYGSLDDIPPGSVVVLDMGGDASAGAFGDVLVARLIAIGVAGVVADGGMRDIAALADMALPVWCAGFAPPPSSRSLLAADVQAMVGCGGVLVVPGDIVVADPSGVAVIPRHLADRVASAGLEQERLEAWIRRRVDGGARVTGLYPPGEAALAEYQAWVAAGRPE
jgi:regulator of RNase E activity RraA